MKPAGHNTPGSETRLPSAALIPPGDSYPRVPALLMFEDRKFRLSGHHASCALGSVHWMSMESPSVTRNQVSLGGQGPWGEGDTDGILALEPQAWG